MVTHIVLFKLKDPSPENLQGVRDKLLSMRGKVPALLEIESGVDYTRAGRSYDVALITRHENRSALEAYQVDPLHREVAGFVISGCASVVAVDFES